MATKTTTLATRTVHASSQGPRRRGVLGDTQRRPAGETRTLETLHQLKRDVSLKASAILTSPPRARRWSPNSAVSSSEAAEASAAVSSRDLACQKYGEDVFDAASGEPDVVVIGSGIGGLCCAALLARYGMSVTVLESHDVPGGAAHAWVRDGYHFESGPSLYSGMTGKDSTNPLAQVFNALDIELPCYKYNTWMCHLPEGKFLTEVGAEQFCDILKEFRGDGAVAEWKRLQTFMEPLARASVALPPAAFRQDFGAVLTAGKFLPNALESMSPEALKLTGSFSNLVQDVVKDPFIKNWLDLLCFLLSGLDASGTIAAEVAFMFNEWYQPNCELDFPVGGSQAMVDALVDGLRKYGGGIKLGAHVEEILVSGDGEATGVRVRYKNGKKGTIRAKKAVVSNASAWDTETLLPQEFRGESGKWQKERTDFEYCPSFMHLHAGIDASKLPKEPEMHHIWVGDWKKGITSPQNCVLVSIPSVLDPSLAPAGKHVIHAYTPGNEPYEVWKDVKRGSEEYKRLKEERSRVLWEAVEKALEIDNAKDLVEVSMVGTPKTHERFLRRKYGTYGPALRAEGLGGQTLPFPNTSVRNLLCTGDSTFPGIGLPAVAASGMLAANSLTSVKNHLEMLDKIGL